MLSLYSESNAVDPEFTSLGARWRRRTRLDQALALALLAVAVNLLLVRYLDGDSVHPLPRFLVNTSYQWCLAAIAFFLLQSAGVRHGWLHWAWLAQALAGTALLAAAGIAARGAAASRAYPAWQAVNVAMCLILAAGIGHGAIRHARQHRWFIAAMALLGLGIAANDVLDVDKLLAGTASGHYLFPVFLVLVWLVVTGRLFGERAAAQAAHLRTLRTLLAEQTAQGESLRRHAVESERKRIASDLHDGVGSQLVNLIATLDPHSPRQQAMAVALEQCLLDLKIMVDSIGGEDDSIIDALARLRYRVQPALDRLGIGMRWDMQDAQQLAHLPADRVLQLLRISQEALSNAMRHARASTLEVTCRYLASNQCLLLEICDDGCGIRASVAQRHPIGRGLAGMRQRAEAMGARIEFSSCRSDGTGTRIMLLLPVPAPIPSPRAAGR